MPDLAAGGGSVSVVMYTSSHAECMPNLRACRERARFHFPSAPSTIHVFIAAGEGQKELFATSSRLRITVLMKLFIMGERYLLQDP